MIELNILRLIDILLMKNFLTNDFAFFLKILRDNKSMFLLRSKL